MPAKAGHSGFFLIFLNNKSNSDHSSMRLTDFEIRSIIETFHEFFSHDEALWLFGSRVDDNQKGGDIDLFIETQEKDFKKLFDKKIEFVIKLESKIGEQKIDVVISGADYSLPIHQHARETGVRLA